MRTVGSGGKVPAWGCTNRIVNGRAVCDSHHINKDVLERTYLAAIRDMLDCADEIIDALRDSAGLVMQPTNKEALDAVDQQTIEVQEAVLALHKAKQQHAISSEEYNQRVQEYSQQMKALEDRQEQLRTAETRYTEVMVWLDAFAEHIKYAVAMSMDDGTMLKVLVEQIVVTTA